MANQIEKKTKKTQHFLLGTGANYSCHVTNVVIKNKRTFECKVALVAMFRYLKTL